MSFTTTTISFTSHDSGLVSFAKRYVPDGPAFSAHGLTLVFGHNVSSHKEMWEPVLSDLFRLCSSTADSHFRVREAWSVEWQSHGQSAAANEDKLLQREGVTPGEYGDSLSRFIQSSHVAGHRLVPIGFSASTAAWLLAMNAMNSLPFTAVILIEPTMIMPPVVVNDPRLAMGVANKKSVLSRKDRWESIEEAAKWMKKRFPWKLWDQRMFDLYLKFAMRECISDDGNKGVTLWCTINQEVNAYAPDAHIAAAPILSKVCSAVPVHIIFGERPEIVATTDKHKICDATQGRAMASICTIPKSGHLVVCERPTEVALRIFAIMGNIRLPSNSNRASL